MRVTQDPMIHKTLYEVENKIELSTLRYYKNFE